MPSAQLSVFLPGQCSVSACDTVVVPIFTNANGIFCLIAYIPCVKGNSIGISKGFPRGRIASSVSANVHLAAASRNGSREEAAQGAVREAAIAECAQDAALHGRARGRHQPRRACASAGLASGASGPPVSSRSRLARRSKSRPPSRNFTGTSMSACCLRWHKGINVLVPQGVRGDFDDGARAVCL